jgi:UDP-N-acetylglucosamine transferase subunit ALG13
MPQKTCFVTVGATASFEALVRAIYQPHFLHALAEHGYTDLTIQCGKGGKELCDMLLAEAKDHGPYGIGVATFEFTQNMMQEMRVAKAEGGREEGVVLCHAGTLISMKSWRYVEVLNACRNWFSPRCDTRWRARDCRSKPNATRQSPS